MIGLIVIFIVFFSGLAGHVARKYDIHLRKNRAYLGFKRKRFSTLREFLTLAVSVVVIAIPCVFFAAWYLFGVNLDLSDLWKIFLVYSFAAYYLLYEQNKEFFTGYISTIRWMWVGITAFTGTVASFWAWERVSNIAGLPQGELPASELLLFSIQFFIVLTFVFMLLNYIPVLYIYVRLLLGLDLNLKGV